MPVTLPAHAAAVLPLMRWTPRPLDALALVVGAAAPDFVYVLGWNSRVSHNPLALLTFCLPVGLVLYLWSRFLVLPLVMVERPPRGSWPSVAASIVIGAATHVLWDGFTHAWMWPARELYPDVRIELLGRRMPIARI